MEQPPQWRPLFVKSALGPKQSSSNICVADHRAEQRDVDMTDGSFWREKELMAPGQETLLEETLRAKQCRQCSAKFQQALTFVRGVMPWQSVRGTGDGLIPVSVGHHVTRPTVQGIWIGVFKQRSDRCPL